ncbi:hypothetical protein WSK_3140 [Novosphingobium sp. Rr 2-17]|uniref:hypothetical protein n=1 Tax=Novosphingobium sp. Rr 2-17 TaxID=555793 RepID=UPI0002698231|nr:hypothetical protein [Novosphingobium sp. Rr 2-17]EIZ78258.1 hypothetical protein WSK_3140 [Novosphingobium sp. Rr 2-17]
MNDGIDLDGVGLTFDDLDLDIDITDDDCSVLPLDRPRHRPADWWTTTEAEDHFLDLPDFQCAVQRTRYFVEKMARAALSGLAGATDDDPLFTLHGKPVSLNELLASIDDNAMARLNDYRG